MDQTHGDNGRKEDGGELLDGPVVSWQCSANFCMFDVREWSFIGGTTFPFSP